MKRFPLFFCMLLLSAVAFAQTPTWSEDIACIVYSHCSSCHNDNGVAPFSLMSYSDAFTWQWAIKSAVEARRMPPWKADNEFNELAHQRALNQQEIDLISAWVDASGPEGDPGLAPDPPIFSGGDEISSPDLTLQIPTYTVPSLTSEDLYRCFVLPTSEGVDKFITGIEVLPGNSNIVHHVILFSDTSDIALDLDAADPGPGYTSFGGVGSTSAQQIGAWVPGSKANFTPSGMGFNLPANANLIMQIHYPFGSTGEVDSSRVNMRLSTDSLRTIRSLPILNHQYTMTDGPLFVPAGEVKTFHEQITLPAEVTLLGIGPHAHLICTSMTAFAVTPVGDTLNLIHIPEWDFHWQGLYKFKSPIRLPAFSTLHGYATYDNTASNLNNPSNPPEDVEEGEATTDEMMLFVVNILGYQPGDELIIVDSTTHLEHHQDCESALMDREEVNELTGVSIYPNPVTDEINILFEESNTHEFTLELYELTGKKVKEMQVNHSRSGKMAVGDLPGGVYLLEVRDPSGGRLVKKVLID